MESIFETAQVATPVTVRENIRRGREAMKHVIATGCKEYRAMYRKDLGWIAFSWGRPGTPPPEFKSKKEAAEWWANLPGKTNGQKGSKVFSGGRGVSHIIAKRDWEAKWMDRFEGQSGREVALECVEVIARGQITSERHKKAIISGNMKVTFVPDSRWVESRDVRAKGKKKEEYWLLSGIEMVADNDYGILLESSCDENLPMERGVVHICPGLRTQWLQVTSPKVGAANSLDEKLSHIHAPCKPRQYRETEYGTAAYGFALNV